MQREPNTQYVLSLSYGKDSLACLEAIRVLGLPLDRIVHAEVWATDTIPADLPPMVEFKQKADAIILERYGIAVEHICATDTGNDPHSKLTFEKIFYRVPERRCGEREREREEQNCTCTIKQPNYWERYGFPRRKMPFCQSRLKGGVLDKYIRISNDTRKLVYESENFSNRPGEQGAKINTVQYLGIAADEPERIARHTKPNIILPLVLAGWDETFCRQLCKELGLLSPIYTTAARGGCWFCHNQGIDQLRLLRKNYPDLWQLLLKWDKDSPVTFHPDGHTVHHFDIRFQAEDEGLVPSDRKFRWKMLGLQIPKQSKGETNGERQD